MNNLALDFLDFIKKSPTAYHATANLAQILEANGFIRLYEHEAFKIALGGKYYITKNDSSIIAFKAPTSLEDLSFNIAASHTDSPTFKVKPNETITSAVNTLMLSLEPYGGTIYSTWLDRPLSLAGRVSYLDEGKIISRLVKVDRPLCVIPNLAIHQNRSINDGYKYQANVDMLALLSANKEDKLADIIKHEAKLGEKEILGMDLTLYNYDRGHLFGASNEFMLAPQIDNLECSYLTLCGFLAGGNAKSVNVYASFDNEEVGSGTKQGALSTFLLDTLERLSLSLGLSHEEFKMALAKSFMLSCDNAHAMHPNNPQISDSGNKVYLNGGIVIKTNANQSYTTDSVSQALFKAILNEAKVKYQMFANRSDQRGGSTLGHLALEHVSIDTVDIGLAQLAMHSAMETAGALDLETLVLGLKAFYDKHLTKKKDNNFIIE